MRDGLSNHILFSTDINAQQAQDAPYENIRKKLSEIINVFDFRETMLFYTGRDQKLYYWDYQRRAGKGKRLFALKLTAMRATIEEWKDAWGDSEMEIPLVQAPDLAVAYDCILHLTVNMMGNYKIRTQVLKDAPQ